MNFNLGITKNRNSKKRRNKKKSSTSTGKSSNKKSFFQLSSSSLLRKPLKKGGSGKSKINIRNIFKKHSKVGKTKKSKAKKAHIKKKMSKILSILVGVAFFGIIAGLLSLGIFLRQINKSLPEPGQLIDKRLQESTIIYDRNGVELYKVFGDQNRVYKKLDEYPKHTVAALLAAEDSEFYTHKGLDWFGIIRCSWLSFKNYVTGGRSGVLCGASTISQQLVRRTLMYDAFGEDAFDRSTFIRAVKRKLREMLMTMKVEQTMSKDQMLEMYMNEVNLGGFNYGFEAGAQSIFGKKAEELTLAESAVLAGLLPAPSQYNPINGSRPEMAKTRQEYVLDQLLKHRKTLEETLNIEITEDMIEAAKNEELVYKPARIDIKAPHFVWYVKDELVQMENFDLELVERGGLRVYTTLDYETQQIAEDEIVKGVTERGHRSGVRNGAMVAITPQNNEIVAMVGSVDYWNTEEEVDGNVNVSTSIRQMGSSFKPFTYLTAFHEGYNPGMAAPDIEEFDFNYEAGNWDDDYMGLMTAREALVKSRNISALNTIQLVGIDKVLETTDKLGITTLTDRGNYGLSLTLGAGGQTLLEHTAAYTVFANEGVRKPVVSILKVENSRGEVLYENEPSKGQRVFDEKEIYLLNWTLCDLGNFGDQLLNNLYESGGKRIACGKTGTTNGPRDLLTMMYHKNLTIGVWTGNSDNSTLGDATSATVPLPIASSFMKNKTIQSKYSSQLYSRPAGIGTVKVCPDTGYESNGDCDTETVVYIKGRDVEEDKRDEIKVCKENDKIPSNMTAAEKFDMVDEVLYLDYEFPNEDQRDKFEEYMEDEEDVIFEKPDEAECPLPLGPGNAPLINIKSPSSGKSYEAGTSISVSVDAIAMDKISKVEYSFGGSSVGSSSSSPWGISFTIPKSTNAGNHVLKAKATDNHGKSSETSIVIKVTKYQPDVSLSLSLSDGSVNIGEEVTFEASASGSDKNQVDEVCFSVNGSTVGCDSGSGSWKYKWTPSSPGSYDIRAFSADPIAESNKKSLDVN
ncbi:hypothetical protein GF357_01145 [Candidatus Dojkabacteria bacterium]|nr:hypothetical protein [Candidatus Dojkabacteria bacterium]